MVYNKSHYYHEYSFMNWATWVMLTVEDSQIARICLLLTTSTVINSWKILIQDVVVLLFINNSYCFNCWTFSNVSNLLFTCHFDSNEALTDFSVR